MKSFKKYVASDKEETWNAERLTEELAANYNGKSSAEMLRGVLAEAEKSKREGTLSNAEIDQFYQAFAPMLNSVQQKKLQDVVEKLKKIP